MTRVVTFGEIMLRLSPPDKLRFSQARSFDVIYGGGESNVAVSLAHFGLDAQYVTRLPKNDIGDACENYLRQFGVGTKHIARGGERLGIYFLEHGAVHRGSKVVYDRAGSALADIQPGMIDWEAVFAECRLVPLDGHHTGDFGRRRGCLPGSGQSGPGSWSDGIHRYELPRQIVEVGEEAR